MSFIVDTRYTILFYVVQAMGSWWQAASAWCPPNVSGVWRAYLLSSWRLLHLHATRKVNTCLLNGPLVASCIFLCIDWQVQLAFTPYPWQEPLCSIAPRRHDIVSISTATQSLCCSASAVPKRDALKILCWHFASMVGVDSDSCMFGWAWGFPVNRATRYSSRDIWWSSAGYHLVWKWSILVYE